jgi:hypothetical protein
LKISVVLVFGESKVRALALTVDITLPRAADLRIGVTLWRLRGYSDPEGEFQGGEIICAIEKSEDGYPLLVEHDGEIQIHESHGRIETARGKAQLLREKLEAQGWTQIS